MAVYEGARPRPTLLPRRRIEPSIRRPQSPALRPQTQALPRRRTRAAMRARRRPRVIGVVLGGIVLTFLLSFFSLILTVRVSASGYDMDQLNAQYTQLLNERQQMLSNLDRLGRESAIQRQAISNGLTQLPPPIVLPAR